MTPHPLHLSGQVVPVGERGWLLVAYCSDEVSLLIKQLSQ